MRNEPRWLPLDEIIATNRAQVAITGEDHLVRDRGLLEGGYARHQNHWSYGDDDIVRIATYLACGIACSHSFEEGNKRTGAVATLMFLALNGYKWTMKNDVLLGVLIEAVVTRKMDELMFAESIRPFIVLDGGAGALPSAADDAQPLA